MNLQINAIVAALLFKALDDFEKQTPDPKNKEDFDRVRDAIFAQWQKYEEANHDNRESNQDV